MTRASKQHAVRVEGARVQNLAGMEHLERRVLLALVGLGLGGGLPPIPDLPAVPLPFDIDDLAALPPDPADAVAGPPHVGLPDLPEPVQIDMPNLLPEPVKVADGVYYLGPGVPPDQLQLQRSANANAADTTNADQLWSGGGLGLSLDGSGYTVGVWDGGSVRSTHQEFSGRVTVVDGSASLSNHATHVAGTIGAAGVDAAAHGMASAVNIRSRDWTNDITELNSDASLISASNHSYSFITGWDIADVGYGLGTNDVWLDDRYTFSVEDPDFGKYGTSSRDLDSVLYSNPNLLSVWAASNDRNDAFTNYRGDNTYVTYFSGDPGGIGYGVPGWYRVSTSVVSAPPSDGNGGTGYDSLPQNQVAKNVLTVGAVSDITADPYTSGNVNMASFSSWGPTDDGRVKPDVVGNGVALKSSLSTSDTAYDWYSGTSMAAPNVTGTAVLLQEYYEDVFGATPRSATMKGWITHTAFDAGNTGPDYAYGWGVMDAAAAVNWLDDADSILREDSLANGSEYTDSFYTDGSEPIKCTLVWTDPAPSTLPGSGLDDSTSVLVNDLDIWVTGPGGTTYYPWTLDPANPSTAAVQTTANHVDNVEQVYIAAPGAGDYTVHVGHSGSISTQAYSLLVSGPEAASTEFSNSTNITIPSSGSASPYPSSISVSGLSGTISDVDVTVNGFSHTWPDDVDMLVVSPAGQKVVIMSDVGGSTDASSLTITLDDAAGTSLADSGPLTSGTFKPTNIGSTDTFSSPAPSSPYASLLSEFNGYDPNGTWDLYVMDDAGGDTGSISGGWSLSISTTGGDTTPPTVTAESPVADSTIADSSVDIDVTFSETVQGVDASDMVLTGTAAGAASVDSPSDQGGNVWRFPVTGLVDGTLNVSLAPDAGDIEDAAGNDLANTTWDYSVLGSRTYVVGQDSGSSPRVWEFQREGTYESYFGLGNTSRSLLALPEHLLVARGVWEDVAKYTHDGTFVEVFCDPQSDLGGGSITGIEADLGGRVYAAVSVGAAKYAATGALSATFDHADMNWPEAIDADGTGNVWVLDQTKTLFKFSGSGTYLGQYELSEVGTASDMAIDEASSVLYVGDETGSQWGVRTYDLSTGAPVYQGVVQVPGSSGVRGLSFDSVSGNLLIADDTGAWEITTGGTLVHTYSGGDLDWAWDIATAQPISDTTPPTADIVDVSPDPRTSGVSAIDIVFSEAVSGFDTGDLALTRDGTAVSLGGATLNSTDDINWTLSGLTDTSTIGNYTLMLAAAGSGITDGVGNPLSGDASDQWTVQPEPPVMDAEPAFTPGTTNTVSWAAVSGADAYYVELDDDSGFGSPDDNSGWITALSHEFTGLTEGQTYYYRVKARTTIPGETGQWSQTTQAEFDTDTLSGVSTSASPGDVVLDTSATVTLFADDFEDGNYDGWTHGSDFAVREVTSSTAAGGTYSFTIDGGGSSHYGGVYHGLSSIQPERVEFSVRSADATDADGYFVAGGGGGTFGDSVIWFYTKNDGQMGLYDGTNSHLVPYIANQWYDIRLDMDWVNETLDFYVDGSPVSADVPFRNSVSTLGRVDLYNFDISRAWWDEISFTNGSSGYSSPGSIISTPITPSTLESWDTLTFNSTTPANTTLTVDVLPATGTTPIAGYDDVSSGVDLSGIAETTIRLRADLATSDPNATPALHDWTVGWQATADTYIESVWSTAESSTQESGPPTVDSYSLTDDTGVSSTDELTSDTTPVLTFQFNETVYGVDGDVTVLDPTSDPVIPADITGWGTDTLTVTMGTLSEQGQYTVTLNGTSTILDGAGNPLNGGADEVVYFTLDTAAPTADIVDVSPDPRTSGVSTIDIVFSEVVVGFELGDLALSRDGTGISLSGASLDTTDDINWTLSGLTDTSTIGNYTLTLAAAGSGVTDGAGNALSADASDQWTVQPEPPVMDTEPALTPGTTNTVSWAAVSGADAYYVELDDDPAFGSPDDNSGWISALSHEFTGLADGQTYHYRVKARTTIPGETGQWSQTTQSEFDTDTLTDVSTSESPGDVVLAGGSGSSEMITFEVYPGPDGLLGTADDVPVTAPNLFADQTDQLTTQYASVGIEFLPNPGSNNKNEILNNSSFGLKRGTYLLASLSNAVEAQFTNTVTQVSLWTNTGTTDPTVLTAYDSGGSVLATDQAVNTGNTQLSVSTASPIDRFTVTRTPWTAAIDDLEFSGSGGYVSSGYIISTPITPSTIESWDTLTFNSTTPANTTLTVDVLPATGTTPIAGYDNVSSGVDLSGITDTTIRLRADLATSDPNATPALHDWAVGWQVTADTYIESTWSTAESSTQESGPPTVDSYSLTEDTGLDSSDELTSDTTPVLTFQFNETVYGVDGDVTVLDPTSDPVIPADITGWGTDTLTVTMGTLSEQGQYTVTLNGTSTILDGAGNPLNGGADEVVYFTLDSVGPTVTSYSLSEDTGRFGDDQITMDTTPVLTFGFSEDIFGSNSDVEVRDSASNLVTPATINWTSNSLTLTFNALSDDEYTVTLDGTSTIEDAAGNALKDGADEVVTFTVDTTPPSPPTSFSPGWMARYYANSADTNDVITGDSTPLWVGRSEPGAVVSVLADGSPIGSGPVDAPFTGLQMRFNPIDFEWLLRYGWGPQDVTLDSATLTLPAGYHFDTVGPNAHDFYITRGSAIVVSPESDTLDDGDVPDESTSFTMDFVGFNPGGDLYFRIDFDTIGMDDDVDVLALEGTTISCSFSDGSQVELPFSSLRPGPISVFLDAGLAGTFKNTYGFSVLGSALTEGQHAITAQATDLAGNTGSAAAPLDVTIDLTAPAVTDWTITDDTGSDPDDKITNDSTPALTFTFSEVVNGSDTDLVIKDPDGGTVTPDTISGWGTDTLTAGFSTDLTLDGEYTVTLSGTTTIRDLAGRKLNGGSDEELSFTLDTTPPAAPTSFSPGFMSRLYSNSYDVADNVTADGTPLWVGNAEPGATVTVSADGTPVGSGSVDAADVAVQMQFEPGAFRWRLDYNSGPAGIYMNSATLTLPTGYHFDTVGPNALDFVVESATGLVVLSPESDGLEDGDVADESTSFTMEFADFSDGDRLYFHIDFDTVGMDDDVDVLALEGTTITCNFSDGGKATLPFSSLRPGSQWSLEQGLAGTWKSTDGFSILSSMSLTEGSHSITATATDAAGNTSDPSTAEPLMLDFTAPTVASFSIADDNGPDAGDLLTNDTTPILTFTFDEAVRGTDADITILDPDSVEIIPAAVTGWGTDTLSIEISDPLMVDGEYTVTLSGTTTVRDVAGWKLNGGTDEVVHFTLETVAPTVTGYSLSEDTGRFADDEVTMDTTPVLTFGFSEAIYGSDGDVQVEDSLANLVTPDLIEGWGTDALTVTFSTELSDETYTVTLNSSSTITDAAGNPLNDGEDEVASFTVDTTPPAAPGNFSPAFLAPYYGNSADRTDPITADTTPLWLGNSEPGSIVTVRSDGVVVGAGPVDAPDVTVQARFEPRVGGQWRIWHHFGVPDVNISAVTIALPAGYHFDTVGPNARDLEVVAGLGETVLISPESDTENDGDVPDESTSFTMQFADFNGGDFLYFYIDVDTVGLDDDVDLLALEGTTMTISLNNDTEATVPWSSLRPGPGPDWLDSGLVGCLKRTKCFAILSDPLTEGSHQITAQATDLAGNVGAEGAPHEVIIDLTTPSVSAFAVVDDNGSDGNDQITNDTTPTLQFTFSEAVTGSDTDVTIEKPGGGTITPDAITGWGTDTLSIELSTPLTADGQYTVTLNATTTVGDVAGWKLNGGTDEVRTFTLDTAAPTLATGYPVLNDGSPAPNGRSNIWNVVFDFTEPIAGLASGDVQLMDNAGAPVAGFDAAAQVTINGSTVTVSLEESAGFTLADGNYYVALTPPQDVAGNTSDCDLSGTADQTVEYWFYKLRGDFIDVDGTVSIGDVLHISDRFGGTIPPLDPMYDLIDGDGTVTIGDVLEESDLFGAQVPTPTKSWGLHVTDVAQGGTSISLQADEEYVRSEMLAAVRIDPTCRVVQEADGSSADASLTRVMVESPSVDGDAWNGESAFASLNADQSLMRLSLALPAEEKSPADEDKLQVKPEEIDVTMQLGADVQ